MKRETAEHIARYFHGIGESGSAHIAVRRVHSGTPLTQFHQWANNRALIAADSLTRDDGISVICLLIDWKDSGNWYLVACDAKTHAPLCEISHEVGAGLERQLVWKYTPTKRDGRNPERVEYFKRVMGAQQINLAIPSGDRWHSTRFADDILSLVEVRLAADELNETMPQQRDSFPEGELIERLHKARERSAAVVRQAKLQAMERGPLACEVCGFDFEERYGDLGKGFIEAHHTLPLSELTKATETRVQDLALVCANCHRMLHRKRPWISVDGLKELLAPDPSTT